MENFYDMFMRMIDDAKNLRKKYKGHNKKPSALIEHKDNSEI